MPVIQHAVHGARQTTGYSTASETLVYGRDKLWDMNPYCPMQCAYWRMSAEKSKATTSAKKKALNVKTALKRCALPESWDSTKECYKNTKRNDEN